MEYQIQNNGNSTTIIMSGSFTFTDNQNFKPIIELASGNHTREISFDFGGVDFIDSAGMGMLLLLRDNCNANKISLSIHSVYGQVEKIFNISKFDQLFSINK